ncbi:MAG: GEVED domain-containing protein [Acidobacteriota bacterium]
MRAIDRLGFFVFSAVFLTLSLAVPAAAQELEKSAVQTDAGSTKVTGEIFGYRLTYRCNATTGDCNNARVVDALPPEVVFVSAIGTSDVATINAPAVGSNGTVEFVMVDPLTAGNSGDLIINVRFPNGSTPDGTDAINTADGVNLTSTPGTFTTPPVTVTAVARGEVNLSKTLTTAANLDRDTTYQLRLSIPNTTGRLNLTGISVSDSLPAGAVFQGASPAADCEPGCVGTVAPALVWSGPFSVDVDNSLDFLVTVVYPSTTFSDGEMVTNEFSADGTFVGEAAPQGFGPEGITHPVTSFVANPRAAIGKNIPGNSPNPPTLNQPFRYILNPRNQGNVDLDNFVVTDTVPIQMDVTSVSTGAYNNPPASVAVSYETNLSAGFVTLGSSPGGTNATFTIPALGAGEYVTRLRWEYGTAPSGMAPQPQPRINGTIIDPDNAGNPVNFGDTVSNCVDLSAVYDPGGANRPVTRSTCRDFVLSGPFSQHAPEKSNLSGSGPFGVGATVRWQLRTNNVNLASDPLPLENLVVVDLLPEDLAYTAASFTYDDRSTGLPAPTLEVIPNYNNSGRTLLRWTWAAASGALAPGDEVWITFDTTVAFGATFGPLSNQMGMTQNDPGLAQRCDSSTPDINDLDGDGDTTDVLCVDSQSATIAPVAQLVSSKRVAGACDANFTDSSAGTLAGGAIEYRLEVTNVGTVPMEDFVLVDILPFVGDTGVLDTSPRLSLWRPLLTAPIIPPAGTVIFYSLSGNPCRPEVGGPTTGCDAPNWTTVPPDPITGTQAIKIEFGNREVGAGDTVAFELRMTAPADLPNGGQEAFNSFAYRAQRGDGLGALSAEPNKVGIAAGTCPGASLGDFVWVDTDGDGTQNDGPTGLDDVFVQLFDPGADGVPRTFDDVLVATTVTAPDAGGDPGWYEFNGLPAGDYYVQFEVPTTYEVTTPNAGGDDTIDSDADPVTACGPVVTLGADEDNPTLDMGLLPPAVSALGNYVWFDRNGNGLQDESPFDGANGVTVKLFGDDGDGVAEPGGDDGMPVATTTTANDVYGNPGYYRFDGLTPGVPYFVQFMLPAVATGFTSQDTGGDDAMDSDADTGAGTAPVLTFAPAEFNSTLDAGLIAPGGNLELGNQVWCDDDNDGLYEPQDAEVGVDGVVLSLYLDDNGDGLPSLGERIATTTTQTLGGNAGRYRFDGLSAGDYLVFVDPENFSPSGALAGKQSSTGNDPAPDPDDDFDGDDNSTNLGVVVGTQAVTLAADNEPETEDGDNNTNLTVDLGFAPGAGQPEFDYGDNPDVAASTTRGDYRTTALDGGAAHMLGAGSPYLGDCVDGDSGIAQDLNATADDFGSFGSTIGTCATPGDDEDGVAFSDPLVPGTATAITVSVGSAADCSLDAWIDWNQNGSFEAGEQIAASLTVSSGASVVLTPTVPSTAILGVSYSRFRCSSAGGLNPVGQAPDGEVEDYLVGIQGMDWADAPDTYGTSSGAGGPAHNVDPTDPLLLGACIDTESDGQPDGAALGDDNNVGTITIGPCRDDEDGVAFPSMLVACGPASVSVTANRPGVLDAWIDFGADGSFDDPVDRVATGVAMATGANTLPFNVPCAANVGASFARFRLSTAGTALPTGPAADGEVEDYVVSIKGNDWGDAPPTYPTLLADDGPRHGVDPAGPLVLGACIDAEADGQPAAGATGDDTAAGTGSTCGGGDDEDGVTFGAMLIACQSATVTVTANRAGVLDAWLDFNSDQSWDDAGERIASGLALAAGANAVTVNVPCGAVQAQTTYARFRLSSTGVASFTGPAMDGEVEDYAVTVKGSDYGDAPDTYGTTSGTGGPNHGVDPASTLFLGACVDTEMDGAPSTGADGDDLAVSTNAAGTCTAGDDEDGVTFDSMIIACQTAEITVTAGAAGILDAWVDFGGEGAFDTADRIFNGQAVAAGANGLTFAVPCDAATGDTYARFRLSSTGVASSGGSAMDGEIEDYLVAVKGADFGDAPDSYTTTDAAGGPSHGVDPANPFFLGACVDTEGDAATPLDGSGDDAAAGPASGTCAGNDDEDGVTFDSMFIACQTLDLTVTASAAGLLDAWIDFAGDGSFGEAGDQVFTDQALTAGDNALTVDVPCSATEGSTYARFRFSSAGGLAPGGEAMDGEVEDYVLLAKGVDFGDAPDTYGTSQGAGGPLHGVNPDATLFLGACVDTEDDAATPLDATGDDASVGDAVTGTCAGDDDEDGVTFETMVVACQTAEITVTAGADGLLDAWLDFGGDGTFGEAEDQVLASRAVTAGSNTLTFPVPCTTTGGDTFARFRLSSAGGLPTGGPAMDGEVEDYAVATKSVDFGDAPDTYGTTFASGGPNHGVTDGFSLGAAIDAETDGLPSPDATGDDLDGTDDEDGITFAGGMAMASACDDTTLTVALTNTAGVTTPLLDAWIDFDSDGAFDDPRDRIASALPLTVPTTEVSYTVPCDVQSAESFARFRLSSTGVTSPTEPAMDGEVEDYGFIVKGLDFGDAADPTFPTLLVNDGARHSVLLVGNPILGAGVDTEPDGLPSPAHNGDDLDNTDDEDGIAFPGVLVPGASGEVTVTTGTTGGLVSGWIDFNQDGDWDDLGEQVLTDVPLPANDSVDLTFPVPVGSPDGTACTRFRISSQAGLGASGPAPDGEVEDHLAPIGVEEAAIGVAKELIDVVEEPDGRFLVTFLIRLVNYGNVPLSDLNSDVDFSFAFAAAASFEAVTPVSSDFTVNDDFDGVSLIELLAPGNALLVGGSGEVMVSVRVDPGGNAGPYECSTLGRGTSPGDVEVTDVSQAGSDPDANDNGDPGDDDEPTLIDLPVSILEIPTVGEIGLLVLAMLLALTAIGTLRRRMAMR